MALRDKRFSAKPREETLAVPEWGGDEVIVRGMTGVERVKFAELARVNALHAQAHIIISCVLDPETHNPLYQEADRDELMVCDGEFLDRLGVPILRLSGLRNEDLERAEKNLNASANGSSCSCSPKPSIVQ